MKPQLQILGCADLDANKLKDKKKKPDLWLGWLQT